MKTILDFLQFLERIYEKVNGATKIIIAVVFSTVVFTLIGTFLYSHEKRIEVVETETRSTKDIVIKELSKMNGYLEGLKESRDRR